MSATVGIVGGTGWLGGAIAERGLSAGVLQPSNLIVSSRSPSNRFSRWPGVEWNPDNAELARKSEIIILSVRPEQFGDLGLDLRDKLVISVMAGVSMSTLQRKLNSDQIVRSMPNAAAQIGRSYTPWLASEHVSVLDRQFVTSLFSCCGDQDEVESEAQLDYLSGLSGTGPAYPALLAKALLQHALASGIPEHVAMKAVKGIICGATPLMDNVPFNPTETVETFVAYRGVTAAGLSSMTDAGFPEAVNSGLAAAAATATAMAIKFDR